MGNARSIYSSSCDDSESWEDRVDSISSETSPSFIRGWMAKFTAISSFGATSWLQEIIKRQNKARI